MQAFDAIGGYCQELRVYWRYDVPLAFSVELKRKAACRETSSATFNPLELVGMVLNVWVMHDLVGDHPETKGEDIQVHGQIAEVEQKINAHA